MSMQKKNLALSISLMMVASLNFFTINILFPSNVVAQTSEENYSNYLRHAIDESVKLTRTYQDVIDLWQRGNYSNSTMAKITETYLPQFVDQLNEFNNTLAPEKYNKVKDSYEKSFANEIKSYEFFRDYLITNNSTANELSNDYLSEALNYETIARNAFTEVANNNSSSKDSSSSMMDGNNMLSDSTSKNDTGNTNPNENATTPPPPPAGINDQV
jgi:hypothetical protein